MAGSTGSQDGLREEARHDQYIAARLGNLEALTEAGIEVYPYRWENSHSVAQVLAGWEALEGPEAGPVALAGRLTGLRSHGKSVFADLLDHSGRIQLFLRADALGEGGFSLIEHLDLGDWVGVTGTPTVTRTGERSILTDRLVLLAKSLRPIPTPKSTVDARTGEATTFNAFTDKEMRYRRRYVDLFVNPDTRDVFRTRARLITELRGYLDQQGFLEVDTPVLQSLHGGASARPFATHHNALKSDMYLRIALELYHKRLIVGGFDRVYEIGRIFRNEGLDRRHNPEFTMLELYQAFADYRDIMTLVEGIFAHWCESVLEGGSTQLTYDGAQIDLAPPYPRRPFFDLIADQAGFDVREMDEGALLGVLESAGVVVEGKVGRGALLDEIFSHFVEPGLVQPVFVIDYPMELSPLARRHREEEGLTERFELFIAGMEFANAFSELNDPMDQRERFFGQMQLLERGDEKAQRLDLDYLRALEYGMPPTGGLGIGMDRVTMLFTDQRWIRDVILFPTMRPEGSEE